MPWDPKKTGTANQYHPRVERDTITTRSSPWIAQTPLPSPKASLLVYAGITAMDQFKSFCPEELRLIDSPLDKTECTSPCPEGGTRETEYAAITAVANEVEGGSADGKSSEGRAKTKRTKTGVFRCSFCLLCEDCCAIPSSSASAFGSRPVVASCPAGGPNGGPLHQHPLVLERNRPALQRWCSVRGPHCVGTAQAMWVCCTAAINTAGTAAAAAAAAGVAGGFSCAYDVGGRDVFAVCAECVARPPPDDFTRSGRVGGIADLVRARALCSFSFVLPERFMSSCLT